jgi:replicative DNA helicase
MELKQQPAEMEIEKSVLASMFLNSDNRADAIETLVDKDFYRISH